MLASEAVERAYREAAIKSVNSPSLTPFEYQEGLSRLNGFLLSLMGAEIGENLSDWNVPMQQRNTTFAANFTSIPFASSTNSFDQMGASAIGSRDISPYPPQNVRMLCRVESVTTVYLPEAPCDGARIDMIDTGCTDNILVMGNGRRIEGQNSQTLLPNFTNRRWFYRADLGNWIALQPLTLTDPLPLPVEFDDLLIAGTAIRLTGLDHIDPSSATMMIFNRLLKSAKQRYQQTAGVSSGGQNMPTTRQAYGDFTADMLW